MEIYIGADHNGFDLKNELKTWLEEKGHTVVDVGASDFEKADDYPDFGYEVAKEVAKNPETKKGILVCGSGVGMAVVANKVPNIRAALIHDPDVARAAQRDDDINVVALGASYVSPNKAKEVLDAWLTTSFSQEERHKRRLDKIAGIEQEHFKK